MFRAIISAINAQTPKTLPGYLPTFCLHFVLPTVLLFLTALVTGTFGAEYGVPYLVWHDSPVKQYWVGFALGVVVLQVFYVGFLLWCKNVGRPDRLVKYPQVVDLVKPSLFFKHCAWVAGQLLLCLSILSLLILLVQYVDARTRPPGEQLIAEEADAFSPPRPNYHIWLPLGGATSIALIFAGGAFMRKLLQKRITPGSTGPTRKFMDWVNDAAANEGSAPAKGGLLTALWQTRGEGSQIRRVFLTVFNQLLVLSIGVVFAAAWQLSSLPVALAIGVGMVAILAITPARWMQDVRYFRVFILLIGVLVYFVVTWLGSKPWCGWPGAFLVFLVMASVLPVGIRYAFPGPTARLLRTTHNRIIDPALCYKYPFHGIAVVFFLFGSAVLFALPMLFDSVSSPVVLSCFMIFMVVSIYGVLAYLIDDALPFAVPAIGICVLLSGLPQYKMRFPGLDYEQDNDQVGFMVRMAQRFKLLGPEDDGDPVAKKSALLDLDVAVREDSVRQRRFDAALANRGGFPAILAARSGGAPPDAELAGLWKDIEENNRILPGKDLRPGIGANLAGLLMPRDIAYADVSGSTNGKDKGPKPMVIVVASGGGVRAAAWTFLVMSELEHRFAREGIAFPYHVRMITGASGGMFGASYYVTSLKAPGRMNWDDARRDELIGRNGRYDKLTHDWLTPIMESMIVNDAPSFFSPFSVPADRGVALEKAWSKHLNHELDLPFEKLAEREREGWCPSLVFTPMIVEDGRRLLISNLDLRYPASNDGHLIDVDSLRPAELINQNRNYSHEALELFRMFPQSKSSFAISTAVRMSASFPYFSPAVPLPTRPRRRVVDAGYFDNYGVSLAAAYLFSKKNQEWFRQNVSKIVILQIRDGQSDDERRLHAIPDSVSRRKGLSSMLSRSLEEITSPIEGLNNGRVGTCSFRNDGLLELLSTYFEKDRHEPGSGVIPQSKRYFTVVNFEFPGHVALSWYLSDREKRQIRSALEDPATSQEFEKKFRSLLDWWRDRPFDPNLDKVAER